MQILFCLSASIFFCANLLVAAPAFKLCLPTGIKVTDVVSVEVTSAKVLKKTTVEQKLAEIRATCSKGALVDSKGKQIRFYRLEGCWGNPPEGYQEILRKQREEVERLRKQFTVIELTCNPDGAPKQ